MVSSNRLRRGRRVAVLAGAAAACLLPGFAPAQTTTTPQGETGTPPQSSDIGVDRVPDTGPASGADTESTADIVVTGTLVRGIAPVGTSVINVDRSQVVASGARSSIELLADVPQVSNFFNRVNVPSTNFGSAANRPLIRGLPTLLLLNGYRIVGTGAIQTSPEPNQIAPGSIERVEVIPGSGASIYGSDAVGGVINFITRRRVNGVEASGRYGFADNLQTQDGQITVGRTWADGSLFASYSYAHHDRIRTSERPYFTQDLRRYGGTDFRTIACPAGTITLPSGAVYGLPGRTPGANLCDRTQLDDFYPEETRHNALVGFNQELGSRITADITAYFSRRETNTQTQAASTSQTITSANPFFRPIGTETSQTVAFAYDPVYGPYGENVGKFDSWGGTAQFAVKLGGDWQAKIAGNYGHSYNFTRAYEINANAQGTAINGTTTATALNPYDLAATNPAVLAGIFNSSTRAESLQDLAQARMVVDGTLFRLFGNEVKVAVGAEYLYNNVAPTLTQGPTPGATVTSSYGSRNVKSAFGELVVPVVGPDNAMAGIHSLSFSASGRYDSYNDVGDTFNPKFAATYEPFEGLSIIGNWGRNFHAPDLTDTVVTVDSRNQYFPVSPFLRGTDSPSADGTRPTILLAGGNPGLQPEKSRTWSVGADYRPSFVPGLSFGATYFDTRYTNQIFLVLPFPASNLVNPSLASYFTYNPTLEQARTLLAGRRNDGFTSVESLYAGPASTRPFLIVDARRANLGTVLLAGVDFRANYNHDFGDLSLSGGVGGNYLTKSRTQQVPNTPFNNNFLNGTARLSLTANVGARIAGLAARATFTETGSYPVAGIAGQTRVDDFEVVDLFFSYDLVALGLQGTQVTLNVDNVTDTIPPFFNNGAAPAGRANGSTLGRTFTFGVSTKF